MPEQRTALREPAILSGEITVSDVIETLPADTPSGLRGYFGRVAPIVIVFVLFVLAWEAAVKVFNVSSFLVPTPTSVAHALWLELTVRPFQAGGIGNAIGQTFSAALIGFGIASVVGIAVAVVFAWVPRLQRWFMPYVVAFQTVPRLAIAPLFIIWFGHGIEPKIAIVALLDFFPVLVNALAGFQSIPDLQYDLMRTLRASRVQIFLKLQLPAALPMIFAGLEIALIFSVLGVLVIEFVGATGGVGVLIITLQQSLDIAGVFAAIIVVMVCTVALRGALLLTRRFVIRG